jgi:hypothetical protein
MMISLPIERDFREHLWALLDRTKPTESSYE